MTPVEATALARRLGSAPGWIVRGEAVTIYAERLLPWEHAIAERAVERLIDSSVRTPSVADLREAYAACGGSLADPGRNMSPPVARSNGDPATAAERREAIAAIRSRAAELSSTLPAPDDEVGAR